MDTAALVITDHLLESLNLRQTARLLSLPPATVSAALQRIERALVTPLLQKSGSGLMRTLDGERLRTAFHEMAADVRLIFALPPAMAAPLLTFTALSRLQEVARKGSIRAAARELGIGQPQLTRQIAHAEEKIGAELLSRQHEGAVPTASGLRVIAAARRIEDIWREASARSGERFRRQARAVRVGAVFPLGAESAIAGLLAHLSARWRLRHPRQPLFITSMIAEELLNGVRRGLYDLVLLDLADLPDDLEGAELSRSPLVLVAAPETAERAGGALANLLLGAPLALPSARSGLRQIIDRLMESEAFEGWRTGIEPVEVDSIPVILRLVEEHGFVTFLPAASLPPGGGKFSTLSLPVASMMPLKAAWPKAKGDQRLIEQVLSLIRG